MNLGPGPRGAPVLKSDAAAVETHAIEIQTLSAGTKNSYKLRGEV
jgi:hypothetical protein